MLEEKTRTFISNSNMLARLKKLEGKYAAIEQDCGIHERGSKRNYTSF